MDTYVCMYIYLYLHINIIWGGWLGIIWDYDVTINQPQGGLVQYLPNGITIIYVNSMYIIVYIYIIVRISMCRYAYTKMGSIHKRQKWGFASHNSLWLWFNVGVPMEPHNGWWFWELLCLSVESRWTLGEWLVFMCWCSRKPGDLSTRLKQPTIWSNLGMAT